MSMEREITLLVFSVQDKEYLSLAHEKIKTERIISYFPSFTYCSLVVQVWLSASRSMALYSRKWNKSQTDLQKHQGSFT